MGLVKLNAERTTQIVRSLEETRRVLAKAQHRVDTWSNVTDEDRRIVASYSAHAARLESALAAGEIEIPGLDRNGGLELRA